MEGGPGHKVAVKGYVLTINSQMASTGAMFTSIYYTKQLSLWSNSLASHVVNHSQLPACQGKMETFDAH